MLVRLGTAIVLSMAVMVFTFPLYTADVGIAHSVSHGALATEWVGLLKYASLLFTLPVLILLGWPLMGNAVEQWRRGVVTTDALIVVGVAAAFGASAWATLSEAGHTWFETICMLLVLVTIGRYLETRGRLQASEAIHSLDSLLPNEVEVTRSGRRRRLPLRDVVVGDLVHVAAGEAIPVDGVVESGRGMVNEQMVTGESKPVLKTADLDVLAGSTSVDGSLNVRATAVGRASTVGRMTDLLEVARRSKGRFDILADRLTRVFLPITLTAAVVGAVLGWQTGGVSEAIRRGLAVLLISCPCALGIATPLATWVALGRAARRGILFRTGRALENLAAVRTFLFDKTGTLTTGVAEVKEFLTSNGDDEIRRKLIGHAAGLGRCSRHVLSESLVRYSEVLQIPPTVVSESKSLAGYGIVGQAGTTTLSLGSVELMTRESKVISPRFREIADLACKRNESFTCVAVNDGVEAIATFDESLRPEARDALKRLQNLGLNVEVLSGDHAIRAASLAESLGVPARGGMKPEDKVRAVEAHKAGGQVAMIGDGLNDAPALSAANVGLAMGCGADLSRESADICLLGNDLLAVPCSWQLARRTLRTIKGNLVWAFLYNACCIPLAMIGWLHPVMAALAMVFSSLFVVMNSARIGGMLLDD
jgi:heavy metal translocating P-type ATPase